MLSLYPWHSLTISVQYKPDDKSYIMELLSCMHMLHLVVILSSVYLHPTHGHAGNEWSYKGVDGPRHWSDNFPHCAGLRQSPVSILTNEAVVDSERLVPIHMRDCESPAKLQMRLENKGHTVEVEMKGEPSSITGGGLTDVYKAKQFHFHWGKIDKRGSEHAIDGNYFPMEMHIVHYSTKYTNFSEALDKQGGLAVLAFLFEVGNHNIHFEGLINHLSKVPYKGDHAMLETFSFRHLLPSTLDTYCHYNGSLTTPPCYESVNWFIFYETIEISAQQLNTFRHIHQNFENQTTRDISNDFRPTQSLNLRIISCSKDVRTRENKKASKGNSTMNFGQHHSTQKKLTH